MINKRIINNHIKLSSQDLYYDPPYYYNFSHSSHQNLYKIE